MLKLNCDLGEGFGIYRIGEDNKIMPYIDMANLACGFHASDPSHMQESVRLAKMYGVSIGAHPSYPDLQGFGRRVMQCTPEEIEAFMLYQIGALDAMCRVEGTKVDYVKPHGALYNQMMKEPLLFESIVHSIAKYNIDLPLVILSTPQSQQYEEIAEKYGIRLMYELFADRAYTNEGRLVSRSEKGAVIEDESEVLGRIGRLLEEGVLESNDGALLHLKADTLCVHGDTKTARSLVIALRDMIDAYRDS
ncbi:5-oxoprolinase subunit PxpA [Sulfurovum sp. ST-21]|uniref:5-oxoprolinase subunit A n=1 Tax=Sulfurovum indicum TaxID=2779528 RepID=A0A7M1S1Q9_9BACT|nr:5-oxoprolinase subunit PxpA [Sulfurovum indicum]QOR61385.1 5-oxoprolinase subunit PxpA [Sulfurovum indicum]